MLHVKIDNLNDPLVEFCHIGDIDRLLNEMNEVHYSKRDHYFFCAP